LAFLVIATSVVGGICQELTSNAQRSHASEDALTGIGRILKKIANEVQFVSLTKHGVYRFWPRGTYKSVTYDGTICTDLILDRSHNSVKVITLIFVKNKWQTASTETYQASQLLERLSRNDGTTIGIPLPLQREMASSSLHRRIVCGISLQHPPGSAPE
jgi:hypothetical protein